MKAYIPRKRKSPFFRRKKRSLFSKRPGFRGFAPREISLPRLSVRGLLLGLLLVCVLGIGLHFYFRHEMKQLSVEKERLLVRKDRLLEQITRLKKDPSAYEDVARQKYGLIKDGERLIILED